MESQRNLFVIANDRYGNMIWLGAILVSADLEPDPMAPYEGCPKKCRVCIDLCPQNALDGTTINQKRCREHSISCTDGGGWVLSCNICRKTCPNHAGIKAGSSLGLEVESRRAQGTRNLPSVTLNVR